MSETLSPTRNDRQTYAGKRLSRCHGVQRWGYCCVTLPRHPLYGALSPSFMLSVGRRSCKWDRRIQVGVRWWLQCLNMYHVGQQAVSLTYSPSLSFSSSLVHLFFSPFGFSHLISSSGLSFSCLCLSSFFSLYIPGQSETNRNNTHLQTHPGTEPPLVCKQSVMSASAVPQVSFSSAS